MLKGSSQAGRRRRIRLIRKRAIAGSVVAFGAACAAIGYQLVSGHDPALGKNSKAAVVAPASGASKKKSAGTAAGASGSTATGSTSTGSTATGSTSTGSSSSSSSQQAAPVTTRQS